MGERLAAAECAEQHTGFTTNLLAQLAEEFSSVYGLDREDERLVFQKQLRRCAVTDGRDRYSLKQGRLNAGDAVGDAEFYITTADTEILQSRYVGVFQHNVHQVDAAASLGDGLVDHVGVFARFNFACLISERCAGNENKSDYKSSRQFGKDHSCTPCAFTVLSGTPDIYTIARVKCYVNTLAMSWYKNQPEILKEFPVDFRLRIIPWWRIVPAPCSFEQFSNLLSRAVQEEIIIIHYI